MEWKKISETKYKVGFRNLLRRVFILPNGNVEEFYIKDEGNPVCILPITKDNMVVLAKQFRPGPEKVLLELPGGKIEDHELPIHAAQRELLEETGYSGDVTYIGSSLACGYSNMVRSNFVAIKCEKVIDPLVNDVEFTESVEMSISDFIEHLKEGNITDITTGFLGLLYLGYLKMLP